MIRHNRRRFRVITILSVLGVALAACSSSTSASSANAAKKPVTIGISLSLSGDFAAQGAALEHGYVLWQQYANSHGGLLGRPVQLKILSDASSPTQVVTNYQDLITADHVNLVMGPYSSLLSLPAARIAQRYGYAMMDPVGSGPSLFTNHLHNIFSINTVVYKDLVPFAHWVASLPPKQRPATAAIATSNGPFTEPQMPPAEAILRSAGIKIVYSTVFPSTVTDYTPIADAVASSGAQLVIVGALGTANIVAFAQDFRAQHYNPEIFLTTAGADTPSFLKIVGVKTAAGIMFPDTWYAGFDNAGSKAFVAAYLKKYGGTPSEVPSTAEQGFAAGQVLAAAVKATHSINNKKIISYLHSGVTVQTIQGPVEFNSAGYNYKELSFIMQWQENGQLYQVLPLHIAGTKPMLLPRPAP